MKLYTDFLTIKSKFYSNLPHFKKFENISLQDIETIKQKVDEYLENLNNHFSINSIINKKLQIYQELLTYLSNPNIFLYINTFDERLLFLILAIDPECITYKYFLSSIGITSHTQNLGNWEKSVRNKIGIFDKKLGEIEKYLIRKFSIIDNVIIDQTPTLINSLTEINSLTNISNDQINNIDTILTEWNIITNNNLDNKTVVFNLLHSNLSNEEKLILYIKACDPELKMLQIYFNESTNSKIKEECIKQLGMYNNELIRLEKIYYDNDYNNFNIDTWEYNKIKIK